MTRRARTGEIWRGLLAAVLLLAVVAGIPTALIAFVGNPLPTTWPSRSWLDAELSTTVVLDVLAILLWIAWAHFVVCFLAESRAWARGRPLRREPAPGSPADLARKWVAAVALLGAGAVYLPAGAVAADLSPLARLSFTQVVATGGEFGPGRSPLLAGPAAISAPSPDWVSAPTADMTGASSGAQTAAPAGTSTGAPTGAPAGDPVVDVTVGQQRAGAAATVTYTVQPPAGRHHDCLWDIAERTLGDPMRYHEIYDLNRDRVQPDGSRLQDADLIRPGWTLILPADAAGSLP